MARRWLALVPHIMAMLVLYAVFVTVVALAFDVQDFWVSLGIAFGIALGYPPVVRRLGVAPAMWQRD